MKLTPNRLKFYAAIADECRYIAEDFNNVTRYYGSDFRVEEYAEVSVDVKKKYVEVNGSFTEYGPNGYADYQDYTIQIPFGFIEDPIEWEDQWHEKEHQKLLDAIAKKISDKKEKKERIKKAELEELARLKDKYELGKPDEDSK
jgi:hypothetical protein